MQCSLQHKLPMAMAKLLQSHTCHGSTCCYSRLSLNHSRNPNSTYSLLHCKAKGTGKSQKRRVVVLVASASAPEPEKTPQAQSAKAEPEKTTPTKPVKVLPKKEKPVYSMKKGQIVRVDKEKYLNSINYLSVGHPPYFKGLDYIYEDRGEILNLRHFETGEYALISWVGIPTAPAWLPTYMLIKSEKLNYERM